MKYFFYTACLLLSAFTLSSQVTYDIVIQDGRVMDPETEFDGVRNIGIIGDQKLRFLKINLEEHGLLTHKA